MWHIDQVNSLMAITFIKVLRVLSLHTPYLTTKAGIHCCVTCKDAFEVLRDWVECNVLFKVPTNYKMKVFMARKLCVNDLCSAHPAVTHLTVNNETQLDIHLELPYLVELSGRAPLPLKQLSLPSLRLLHLRDSCTADMKNLPTNVRCLEIEWLDPRTSISHLPRSLTSLKLDGLHVTSCDNLPAALTHLQLGKVLASVDHLPASLTHLHITDMYNNIDNLPNLTHLTIVHVNVPVDSLPSSLVFLKIGIRGQVNLDHLPPGLLELHLAGLIPCLDHLPEKLRRLTIAGNLSYPSLDWLPESLEILDLVCSLIIIGPIDHLPRGMKKLRLSCGYNRSIDHLPANLRSLHIKSGGGLLATGFSQSIRHLPSELETLKIMEKGYKAAIPSQLKKLRKLQVHSCHQIPSLPCLEHLWIMGTKCDQENFSFPHSLKTLIINTYGLRRHLSKIPTQFHPYATVINGKMQETFVLLTWQMGTLLSCEYYHQ